MALRSQKRPVERPTAPRTDFTTPTAASHLGRRSPTPRPPPTTSKPNRPTARRSRTAPEYHSHEACRVSAPTGSWLSAIRIPIGGVRARNSPPAVTESSRERRAVGPVWSSVYASVRLVPSSAVTHCGDEDLRSDRHPGDFDPLVSGRSQLSWRRAWVWTASPAQVHRPARLRGSSRAARRGRGDLRTLVTLVPDLRFRLLQCPGHGSTARDSRRPLKAGVTAATIPQRSPTSAGWTQRASLLRGAGHLP